MKHTSPTSARRPLIRTLMRTALLATAALAIACTGMVDDANDGATGNGTLSAKGGNTNDSEVLLVSLGASTSAGVTFDPQLVGVPLDLVFTDNKHIDGFGAFLESVLGVGVDVENLAVPGATSSDVLANQLPDALDEIARYELGAVVTLEGGGNDLRAFQVQYIDKCMSPDPADQQLCIFKLYETVQTAAGNISAMITAIRAVRPDAQIIIQTQYNSLYGKVFNGAACADATLLQIADIAFEGNPATNGAPIPGLNVALRQVAAAQGAGVADISGYLYSTGNDPSFFGGDCTHLSGTRDAIPALGMAADTTGNGFGLLQQMYMYAYSTL